MLDRSESFSTSSSTSSLVDMNIVRHNCPSKNEVRHLIRKMNAIQNNGFICIAMEKNPFLHPAISRSINQ